MSELKSFHSKEENWSQSILSFKPSMGIGLEVEQDVLCSFAGIFPENFDKIYVHVGD